MAQNMHVYIYCSNDDQLVKKQQLDCKSLSLQWKEIGEISLVSMHGRKRAAGGFGRTPQVSKYNASKKEKR